MIAASLQPGSLLQGTYRIVRRIGGDFLCAYQETIDSIGLLHHRFHGSAARQRSAIGAHRRFKLGAQRAVTRIKLRFDRFHPIEVSRQRQLGGLCLRTSTVSRQARRQSRPRQRNTRQGLLLDDVRVSP